MADGYARAGDRLGVVITSTGPGAGYAVPAILEAWGSCSPVLMITTNVKSTKIGQGIGTLHELDDQDALFRRMTKGTFMLRKGDSIGLRTREAVRLALSDRPGPVYLEVPTDLLDKEAPAGDTPGETGESASSPDLDEALTLLQGARRPILFAGTEALRAGLAADVARIAEKLVAPVITTAPGKGILPEDHPLSFGNAARRGVVRELVQSSDVALAVGTRLREVDAKRRGLTLPQLVHMTWDDRWLDRNFPASVRLTGDLPTTVKALAAALQPGPDIEARRERAREMQARRHQETEAVREVHPELAYLDAIRSVLPRESTFVIDNTQLGYWAEYFYPCHFPGGLVAAKGSSIIGFAFAGAVGVKAAMPHRPVVALIGDGGFLYATQELATCVQQGIGFPVIVVNDSAYGIIGYLQKNAYGEAFESDLRNPDFVRLAQAYGAQGTRVETPEGLGWALERALNSGEMWVIELLRTFPEPPFGKY
jgi:acetolactate synthase-1/2/3 large subunit